MCLDASRRTLMVASLTNNFWHPLTRPCSVAGLFAKRKMRKPNNVSFLNRGKNRTKGEAKKERAKFWMELEDNCPECKDGHFHGFFSREMPVKWLEWLTVPREQRMQRETQNQPLGFLDRLPLILAAGLEVTSVRSTDNKDR